MLIDLNAMDDVVFVLHKAIAFASNPKERKGDGQQSEIPWSIVRNILVNSPKLHGQHAPKSDGQLGPKSPPGSHFLGYI